MKRMFNKSGTPKYLRVYSTEGTEHETIDCITAVFTEPIKSGVESKTPVYYYPYVGSSKTTSGFYQHMDSTSLIDKPGHKLGKRVRWDKLDTKLRAALIQDYLDYYDLNNRKRSREAVEHLAYVIQLNMNLSITESEAMAFNALGI